MAAYNADIRIGITGIKKLGKLETQLKNIDTQAKQIRKTLDFKAKAQTIKLNTKGAHTAVKKLEERINRLGRTIRVTLATRESRRTGGVTVTGDVERETKAVQENTKAMDQNAKATEKAAKAKKNAFGKGFATGAGLAAASATSSIPVLNEAVTGGLAASLMGASVAGGALGGALVGVGAAAVAVTADVTAFNNALLKQQRALANTVATNEELEQALEAINRANEDFIIPIGQATEQFTKLNAAARSSGFTVSEVEEVYRGLAAANLALGGDTERLQGILLATQQVFSKGKVQAEELRGQIGERLAGAFAKFAESADLSTKDLDKALQNGEVSLKDFIKFAKSLLEDYEEDAKTIADAPENAGERLKDNLDKLRLAMGPILTDIGNMFINLANTAVEQLTRMFNAINNFGVNNATAMRDQAQTSLEEAKKRRDSQKNSALAKIFPDLDFGAQADVKRREQNLERAQKALDKQVKQRDERLKKGLEAGAKPIQIKQEDLDTSGNGSGSRSGGGRGPRDTVAEATRELAKLQEIFRVRSLISEEETELQKIQRERLELAAELAQELADIEADNLTAASKEAESKVAIAKADIKMLGLDQQMSEERRKQAELDAEKAAAFRSEVADLELALGLERAVTDQEREQLELKRAFAAIDARVENEEITPEQANVLKALEKQLTQARLENTGLSGYLKQLKAELTDTEQMIVSLAQTVETELANAMSTAVIGLIEGTKTAEEAFADMFKNIGTAFIQMATQMIAKALVMKALGIILPGAGSAVPTDTFASDPIGNGAFGMGNFWQGGSFEGGGYTGSGPRAGGVDGRGGFMAVLHPNETVIDHDAVMGKYSASGGGAGGGMQTIRFESTVINNVEYVTTEQAMAMSQKAADDGARRGAAGGHAKSMSTLRNSRSQRAKLGMS